MRSAVPAHQIRTLCEVIKVITFALLGGNTESRYNQVQNI
jgi:hypothetical protein